jgi:hypothetical protein
MISDLGIDRLLLLHRRLDLRVNIVFSTGQNSVVVLFISEAISGDSIRCKPTRTPSAILSPAAAIDVLALILGSFWTSAETCTNDS